MQVFIARVIAFFTALITLMAGWFGTDFKPSRKPDEFRVTAYIRGDYVQTPDSLYSEDFDIITDVILFECASFNNNGEVVYDENKLETALSNIRSAIGDGKTRITLNLLGPGGNTSSVIWEEQMEAQSAEHNKAFTGGVLEDNIIAILNKYNFDGVHFDYEYPLSDEAWKYYNKFLVSLDKKLGEYTLGVAMCDWNIDFSTAAIGAVDTFELMVYDFVDNDGRHAAFDTTKELVEKIGFKGIPAGKINIGLPFYSRPTDMSAYWYAYNGCYGQIDENGWYHCETTGKDFWFNTPDVIEKKTSFAYEYGYGGVMIWHYNCDLPSSHEDSLLRAVDTALKNSK